MIGEILRAVQDRAMQRYVYETVESAMLLLLNDANNKILEGSAQDGVELLNDRGAFGDLNATGGPGHRHCSANRRGCDPYYHAVTGMINHQILRSPASNSKFFKPLLRS